MKKFYYIIPLLIVAWLAYSMVFTQTWFTDFDLAKKESQEKGRPIFIYFSGSDWCGVCMKMKKDILEADAFKDYAEKNLVIMEADFPRMKKHKLDEKTTKQNEYLAERFNPTGAVPHAVLLSPDMKVIKSWDGLPQGNAEQFVEELKKCRKTL